MRCMLFQIASTVMVAGLTGTVASAQGVPQFRDGRTGTVWTPQVLEQQVAVPGAVSPSDRAFDPRAQAVRVDGMTVQHPQAHLMGTVPLSAGAAVPIATLDVPSLQVVPGRYWLSILYLTNNSASTVDAVVGCHFLNNGARVADTRVIIPPAGPGERLGVPVRGPRYDIFVDRVSCELLAPT